MHATPPAPGIPRFLNAVERAVPGGQGDPRHHDNYAAHKHAKVRHWLSRHPR
jgi:hypothetical protein